MKNATIFYNTKYECRYYKEDVILPDDNVTNDEIEYIRNELNPKVLLVSNNLTFTSDKTVNNLLNQN